MFWHFLLGLDSRGHLIPLSVLIIIVNIVIIHLLFWSAQVSPAHFPVLFLSHPPPPFNERRSMSPPSSFLLSQNQLITNNYCPSDIPSFSFCVLVTLFFSLFLQPVGYLRSSITLNRRPGASSLSQPTTLHFHSYLLLLPPFLPLVQNTTSFSCAC